MREELTTLPRKILTMHDAHPKAGEQRELAAQACRAVAEHNAEGDIVAGRRHPERSVEHNLLFVLLLIVIPAALPVPSNAQTSPYSGDSSSSVAGAAPAQPGQIYKRPTEKTKLRNYLFDAFGPYPIAGAALAASFGQMSNSPPEWKQGAEGYGRRFESDFAIAAISNTARYALAEALKEDTLYYRCDCKGVLPRLKHAVISTLTARRGEDGHLVFSVPGLVGPYAGTMAAVYGWYPGRYDAMDALRMGNFNLLAHMGGNIALEFLYSGPHSFLSRMHLNNEHGVPNPGSSP
jgi:hypothetical protein